MRPIWLAALALPACAAPGGPPEPALAASEAEAEFAAVGEAARSPAACIARLERLLPALRERGADIARGPYAVAPGDVRIHAVHAVEFGHAVSEYRCLGPRLAGRRWVEQGDGPRPFTIDAIRNMSFPAPQQGEDDDDAS